MRRKIVAGNWKMNKTLQEGNLLVDTLVNSKEFQESENVLKIIAPPFIHIASIAAVLSNRINTAVAAQNCHHKQEGAFTGEVSAKMIASIGCKFVIIGHSERRLYFGETNTLLAQKVDVAINEGLAPIFCIGENLEERNDEKYFDVVKQQLKESLFHLTINDFKQIVIAYEPVWAIGTGLTATAAQAQEMHAFIRQEINSKYGADIANTTSILYGGSCNSKNATELFACLDVDGGLIGGASLNAADFIQIIKSFKD
jgi:triosephosphate isomerase